MDDDFDDDNLVLLSVADVRVAVPAGNGVEAGLVVLEEGPEPHRRLRMYVGQPEARAIHVSWSRTVPPRPSTWDLFISTISLLDARVDRAIITDVEEQRHYFAQLVIYRAEEDIPVRLTARPSDAIALALRGYGAKLYARPHVLDEAGLLEDGSHWVRPAPPPLPAAEEPPAGETEPAPEWSGGRTSGEVPALDHAGDLAGPAPADPEPAGGGLPAAGQEHAAEEPAAGPRPQDPEEPAGTDPAAAAVEADDPAPGASFDRHPAPRGWRPPGPPPPDRTAEAAGRSAAARSARSFRDRSSSPDVD